MKPATPTPSKCHPVKSAILVKLSLKWSVKVSVFAARSGDRVDAMMDSAQRTPQITSRFHSGQFCMISQHDVSFTYMYVSFFIPADRSGHRSVAAPISLLPYFSSVSRDHCLVREMLQGRGPRVSTCLCKWINKACAVIPGRVEKRLPGTWANL